MRTAPLLLAACALAACSSQPAQENGVVAADGNDAAAAPEAGAPAASDEASAPVADTTPAEPAPGAPGTPSPSDTPAEEASAPDSADAAAAVVERYHALIAARDYRAARALWEDGGRASGMSAQAFAASFAKYATYRADVGTPGRVDAGAGQRYVTVPVRVDGRLRDGDRPFALRGSMVLHRVADIPGSTAEQRSWRIRSADLKPRPGEAAQPEPAPAEDNRPVARYRCVDGSRLQVRFDPDNRRATVRRGGERLAVLEQQRAGSGIRYASGGYELRGKGEAMTFSQPDLPPLPCTVIR